MILSDTRTRLLLVLVSGVAMALAFPKFNLNLLAWVALVPLLYAVAGLHLRGVFFLAWLQGLVFSIITLYWVVIPLHSFADLSLVVAIGPMLLLAAVEALYIACAVTSAAFVNYRLQLPWLVTLPLAWTGVEWLRSFFPVGFPWDLLGYTAYRNLELIQFAEFTGVYGVSALIVFFNAVVYTVIAAPHTAYRLKVWSLSLLTLAMAGAFVFGSLRIRQLDHVTPKGELRVAMIQGDIPQSIKWNPAFLPSSFKVYVTQSEAAAQLHPNVIIWPEAAAAFYFQPHDRYPAILKYQASYRQRLLDLARKVRVPILFGAPAFDIAHGHFRSYNRAYLVSGEGQVVDYYDKIELAPFAEYVPGQAVLGYFVNKIVAGLGEFVPGRRQTLFDVDGAKLGVLICYEGIFPDLARKAVKKGADVLVNITNDAWYGKSSAPYQLLAMSALRAVETHEPMVRVANTGISAIIRPDGEIIDRTQLFVRGHEVETVAWRHVETVYTAVGDVFAKTCFGLTLLGLLCSIFIPRRPAPQIISAKEIIASNGLSR